jgi:hypothetical protein
MACGFGEFDAETGAVGEDQALLVQAQMHRVGAQPAGVCGGRRRVLAEYPQGRVGDVAGEPEGIGERGFDRLRRPPVELAACDQRTQARARQGVEGITVIRLGPDQFGDNEGDLHTSLGGVDSGGGASRASAAGGRRPASAGRRRRRRKSVA